MSRDVSSYAAIFGVAAIVTFALAFLSGAIAQPTFDPLNDYMSTLGSLDHGFGFVWSVPAFGGTGALLAVFGWLFGVTIQDRWISLFLVVAGLGFALAAVPVDLTDAEATTSKIHFVAICCSLAGWCFAMARIGNAVPRSETLRKAATYTVAAAIGSMVLHASGLISEPILHRLLILIILGWVAWTSVWLFRNRFTRKDHHSQQA